MAGGLLAVLLLLPESMAYGAIAFGPLGAAYISLGIVAGLMGLAFANVGAAFGGGVPIMVSKPQSLAAIMLASILGTILLGLETAVSDPAAVAIALSLLFLVVIASGVWQIVLGLFKIGSLVESIPYPVIAGLRNGTYLKIVLAQLPPLLGLAEFSQLQLADHLPHIQPYTAALGLVTMLLILLAQRWLPQLPAPLLGIVGGTALYYLLATLGFSSQLGSTIGRIPHVLPTPRHLLIAWQQLDSRQYLAVAAAVLPLSLVVAAIVTIKSAEAALIADSVMKERSNFNRELMGQGVGNLLSGIFGGIANAGNSFVPTTIYKLGARTPLARVSCALFALLILLFVDSLIAPIPLVVLAGTLIVVTYPLVSRWSLTLARTVITSRSPRDKGTADLLLVVLVMVVLLFVGIYQAVLLGVLASGIYFIYRMVHTAVRAAYDGATLRSYTQRCSEDTAWLTAHGHAIQVLELQGSIFFATAGRLAKQAYRLLQNGEMDILIIDFAHVSDMDSTGAAMLEQLHDKMRSSGRPLLLSGFTPDGSVYRLLETFGLVQRLGETSVFLSLNEAMEQAETRLLDKAFGAGHNTEEVGLGEVRALQGLPAADLAILQTFLRRVRFEAGETAVRTGDHDQRLFYLVQGRANLIVWSERSQQMQQVSSFRAGTTFGEMALLDGGPRSATIIAAEPLVCYELTAAALDQLKGAHPDIAYQVLAGLGIELASRVRMAALSA